MADDAEELEVEDEVVRKGDDAKAHKELNKLGGDAGGEKEMDTGKAQNALSKLASAQEAEAKAKAEREKELSKVKVSAADLQLVMSEMEVDEARADRVLRENGGDATAALRFLVNA
mmetsp:Transcript_41366/g.80829  ORF Transcript_41366/g.80829 Transcript_41366/m.80829 type:complete len:116 (+) Transcript_41366:37-384(+)